MAAAPSAPRPYDPDRWARRWGFAGVGLLIVGFALPTSLGAYAEEVPAEPTWAWSLFPKETVWGKALILLPVLVAAVLADLTFRWRGVKRGVAFLAGGGAVVLEPFVSDWARSISLGAPPLVVGSGMLLFGVTVACIAIGAGNHVRSRWPSSQAARLLPAVGGAFLVLYVAGSIAVLLAVGDRGSEGPFVPGWAGIVQRLLITLFCVYGLLALVGIRVETGPTRRGRALGRIAVALPVLVPTVGLLLRRAALREADWGGAALRPLSHDVLEAARDAALDVGPWILMAVGLASWIEARLVARDVKADPRTLDRVFR